LTLFLQTFFTCLIGKTLIIMKKLYIFITLLFFLNQHSFTRIQDEYDKKALAILGDMYHAAAPLYSSIVVKLNNKGYNTDVILDYNVPFDKLSEYDIIVLSRYGYDNARQFREHVFRKPEGRNYFWISPGQEQAIENYVKAGGHLFIHHDGFGYYPRDGGIVRLAKAFFISHPPVIPITVKPTGKIPELSAGVEPFIISDEEYKVEMDDSVTKVFMESYSEKNGRSVQGWTHEYGKGKVVVFIPGHDKTSLEHPMVDLCIANIIKWLDDSATNRRENTTISKNFHNASE
jgi:type 1 glutamine amidotransferase